MSLAASIQHIGDTSPLLLLTSSLLATVLLIPACTYLLTTLSYHLALSRLPALKDSSHGKEAVRKSTRSSSPPMLPYSLPFLGSALSFLSHTPGKFWQSLFRVLSAHPGLSILTVYMGGRKLHMLYSPTAVTAFFKLRNAPRHRFTHDVVVKGFGLPAPDVKLIYGSAGRYGFDEMMAERFEHGQMEVNNKHLLSANAVNSLTTKFVEVYQRELRSWHAEIVNSPTKPDANDDGWRTIELVDSLKRRMFTASTEALYGSRILEIIPDLAEKYWAFDTGILARFYGVPRFLNPAAYRASEELNRAMTEWVKAGNSEYDNDPPMDVEWEEWIGGTIIRARRIAFQEYGLSDAGIASFEMGFMFGLSSNAIPATTWMLCHLLAPSNVSLLAKIQEEVEMARRPGGKVDIPTLLSLPHLTSAFNETLRVYLDVLVTRELRSDETIDGNRMRAGDVIIAPQYLAHRDPAVWDHLPDGRGKPEGQWFGERFLKYDEKTGKPSPSTKDMAGKFYPWGGGTNICPGRVFAKQEVLAGVAAFLLQFELRFESYLRTNKNGTVADMGSSEADGFPVVKKQYSGNGVVAVEGDVRISVRQKAR